MSLIFYCIHLISIIVFLVMLIAECVTFVRPVKGTISIPKKNRSRRIFRVFMVVLLSGICLKLYSILAVPKPFFIVKILLVALTGLLLIIRSQKPKLITILLVVIPFYIIGIASTKNLSFKSWKKNMAAEINIVEQNNEQDSELGRKIYIRACQQCHGASGDKGLYLATNLNERKYTNVDMIKNGALFMPGYDFLTEVQINAVSEYAESLYGN